MLWHVSELLSFLWLINSPWYRYTTMCLFIHQLMDIWIVSTFCLLSTVLLWTFMCKFLKRIYCLKSFYGSTLLNCGIIPGLALLTDCPTFHIVYALVSLCSSFTFLLLVECTLETSLNVTSSRRSWPTLLPAFCLQAELNLAPLCLSSCLAPLCGSLFCESLL